MTDDSIRQEIEANNERQNDEQDGERGLAGLLDDAITPATDAIGREDIDTETIEERREGNDVDQRS